MPNGTDAPDERKPGKVATRLLAFLHRGMVLRVHSTAQTGASENRVSGSLPRWSVDANGVSTLCSEDPDCRLHAYAMDKLWELEDIGWVAPLPSFSPYVHLLTQKGLKGVVELFGDPPEPLGTIEMETDTHPYPEVVREVLSSTGSDGHQAFGIDEAPPRDIANLTAGFEEILDEAEDEDRIAAEAPTRGPRS